MAKKISSLASTWKSKSQSKRTSIGNSTNTYPKNKKKRASYKKYRGQGK